MFYNILFIIYGIGLVCCAWSSITHESRIDDINMKIANIESDINTIFDDVEINDEDCDDADYYDFSDDTND